MRIALAIAALLLAACSSQSTTETKQVTDNTPADGRRRAEVHTALAGEYYARGNYPVALSEVRAAINDDSSYYGAYNMQGLVLMQLRETNAARESFNQALKLQPNNPEVLNNYGWFLCVSTSESQRGLELIKRAQLDSM
jgi:type IV pilus assembly protein PilF